MRQPTYSDEELAKAVGDSRSWRGVLRELGLAATSASAIRSVRSHVARLGLDTTHFTGQRRWTEGQLADAVASSTSWGQVTERLGLAGGSSTTLLKGHAVRLGLDVDHLTRTARRGARLDLAVDPARLPRAGSLLAAGRLSLAGFDVSWPLEPCAYDLVAARGGSLIRIQVKTTRVRKSGSWVVDVSSRRGGRVTYDPDDIDHFHVIDADLNHYLIPVATVGGLHALTLSSYEDFRLPDDRREPA